MAKKPVIEPVAASMNDVIRNRAYQIWEVAKTPPVLSAGAARPSKRKAAKVAAKPKPAVRSRSAAAKGKSRRK